MAGVQRERRRGMDKNRLVTCHYCPACGEQSYTPLPVILPGQYDWKCPKCGERFRIDIGFYEKEDGDGSKMEDVT